MKRRNFLQKTAATGLATAGLGMHAMAQNTAEGQEWYEIRTYHVHWAGRIQLMHRYLQSALIPALNRMGVERVGVFTEQGDPSPPKLRVLIPYPTLAAMQNSKANLTADSAYQEAAEFYQRRRPDQAIFTRVESAFFQAFAGLPKMRKTDRKADTVFELRTYESFNEDAGRRKVSMFNDGEIDLFDTVGLHPVFFGEAVFAANLPQLTYMLQFDSMEEREANWATFLAHPEWKRIAGMDKYANTVSNIIRHFLVRTEYSQI
ncbi:MAG: NIPSNAP family protein [Bacteroidota bacterium]